MRTTACGLRLVGPFGPWPEASSGVATAQRARRVAVGEGRRDAVTTPVMVLARLTVLMALVVAPAVGAAAPASAKAPHRPTAVIDWRMPALTVDANGDGAIDPYLEGNRTADVPADGRYDVVLDGCGSEHATSFEWKIRSRTYSSSGCSTTVRLPEGDYWVKLKTRGPGGTAVSHRTVTVRTHLVLGLGDSYGAGSGAQVLTDNPVGGGYYDLICGRTPRSHQALAALQLEQSDPRSSVIFIHLSCGGAQINPGLLTPFRGNRPQVDQARDLVNGQPIDALLLSIGGNDVGFGAILQQCLLTPGIDCPTTPYAGYPTFHEFLMAQLGWLRDGNPSEPIDGLPLLAECLGGVGCTTSETPDGSGQALDVDPGDVLYTTYPDLTRDDSGGYCDVVPGAVDPGLVNTTAEEWAWMDAVVEALDQAPMYTFTDSTGAAIPLAQTSPGLNAVIAESADRYGWSPVTGVYADSFTATTGHGYCAGSYDPATGAGRWTYRFTAADEPTVVPSALLVPVHPNAGGHAHYATEILDVVD
jgi:hypothetical protein